MKRTYKKLLSKRLLKVLLCGLLAAAAALPGGGALADDMVVMTLNYDGAAHVYQNRPVTLSLNEETAVGLSMPPVIIDERVYVPAREVFERLGALVMWDAAARRVSVLYRDSLVEMTIGSAEIAVNGRTLPVSAPPRLINDKTMVPARFVAEALDFFVHWDPNGYVVTILTPDEPMPPAELPPLVLEPQAPSQTPATDATYTEEAPEPTQAPTVYTPDNPNVETGVEIANFARDVSTTAIAAEEHAAAKITGFEQSGNKYTLKADGPVSRVDKILLKDNRLILDIYNAELTAEQRSYDYNHAYLRSVRMAQNQPAPLLVTRVVFDITAAVSFSVAVTADRRGVVVTFEQNYVIDATFYREGAADKLVIEGVTAPLVSLSLQHDPERLIIDLPLANMLSPIEQKAFGNYITNIKAAQRGADTGRITVDLKAGGAQLSVSKIGNQTIITISSQTLTGNMRFDAGRLVFTLAKPAGKALGAAQIAHRDDYLNLTYTLTLPGDYSADYGDGTVVINDGGVATAVIATSGGKTALTIHETRVLAFSVTEDEANVYIRAMSPKEKYDKIVVIDPGHGGSDPGGQSGGLDEKGFNLDIALRLARMIEADGRVKAYFTRLDDTYPTRAERAVFGNELGDIFVSIHNNKYNGTAKGTETLWMPHANDAALGLGCEKMAGVFQKNVVSAAGTVNRRVVYQDVQVLRETVIPACLVEVAFLDSEPDRTNLQSEAFRERAATGIMNGIIETFGVYAPKR